MEVEQQPKIRFIGVDFVSISFNAEQQYDSKQKIELAVDPRVAYPEEESLGFQIFMDVAVICKGYFNLQVLAIGNFEFGEKLNDPELKKAFVNANAPAIMFPYVRSFISTLSINLGRVTGSLVLPVQFFHGELPEFKTNSEDLDSF